VVVANTYVAVAEYADRPTLAASWSLTVPLHPEVELKDGDLSCDGDAVSLFGLAGYTVACGRQQPFAGWHSPTYGQLDPSTWISHEAPYGRGLIWGLGAAPTLSADPPTVDGLRCEIEWGPTTVGLSVTDLLSGDRYWMRAA
jgi:hypothetical protein